MMVSCTAIEYENEFIKLTLKRFEDSPVSRLGSVNIFLKDTWDYSMFTFLSIAFGSESAWEHFITF